MIDTRKVKARMVMLGLTQPDVAQALGINVATFNQKLNNNRRIYLDEYYKLCGILDLNTAEEREELLGVALI
jgi:transcriptional regulator with XRE-family HTH domain